MAKATKTPAVLFVVVFVILITGCASLATRVGVASQEYVDQKLAEMQVQVEGEIAQTNSEVSRIGDTAEKMSDALQAVEAAVQTTEELKELAVILEEKLATLPEETIRQLVQILQDSLER